MVIRLYENPGWGSAIVEVQLAFYGLAFEMVTVGDLYDDPAARAALAPVNPLVQVPTLVMADGQVMTESAAITLLLADMTGSEALVPGAAAKERAAFLRWLIFIVAAIYPGFAYADVPERLVPAAEAEAFQGRVIDHRKAMWRLMEAEAVLRGGRFFLDQRMTAIDLYLGCMVHWRPREDWFRTEAPTLWRAAAAVWALPAVAEAYRRNFD